MGRPGRVLVPAAAMLWGLQVAFLNPTLALLLVSLYDATPAQVGAILAVYNLGGFVAAIVLPAYADRYADYLRPMLCCGLLTVALVAVLAATTSLAVAVVGLVVLGGPAGLGLSMLFAHLQHTRVGPGTVVNTRALVSFSWVAGPPLATFVVTGLGVRALLLAIAAVSLAIVLTAALLIAQHAPVQRETTPTGEEPGATQPSRAQVGVVLAAFVALTATNNASVVVMSLFVTRGLGLDVVWSGIALATAAGLEVPALLLLGRLAGRWSSLTLVAATSVAGIAYFAGTAFAPNAAVLIGLQVLNACFVAGLAGVGMTLFQELVPRPGLSAGLYGNSRRIGSVVSGPLIALGGVPGLGYRSVFVACAVVTAVGLGLLRIAARRPAGQPSRV